MRPSAGPLRVAVVEDQPLYRDMLERTLAARADIAVVAALGTVGEAMARVAPGAADVVLLDIDLPDGNGIALGVVLQRRDPDLGVLLLSAHDAMDLLLDLPRDVRGGWCYLSKTSGTSEQTLVATVHAAAAGRTVLDPTLLSHLDPRRGTPVAGLTPRQYTVLQLIAQGLSNAGIAAHLGISEKSVQNHVNGIYTGLGIDPDPARNPRVTAALRLLEQSGRRA